MITPYGLQHIMEVERRRRETVTSPTPAPAIPPQVTDLLDNPPSVSGVPGLPTVADAFTSAFGPGASNPDLVVVPTGPGASGGGGIGLTGILLLAGLGFGGFWLYKKFAHREAA